LRLTSLGTTVIYRACWIGLCVGMKANYEMNFYGENMIKKPIYSPNPYLPMYLSTYPPIDLPIYTLTYLNWSFIFIFWLCQVANLITPNTKMWLGYIFVVQMRTSYKLHTNGQWMKDHICWPYKSSICNVLTSWWITSCN
jgi:hypothetical protein